MQGTGLQPLLNDAVVTLRAPAQVWSSRDGSIGAQEIHGVYVSDLRVLRSLAISVDGETGEHIATLTPTADRTVFVSLLRGLDRAGPDPETRAELDRQVRGGEVRHTLTVGSRRTESKVIRIAVSLRPDLTPMEHIKVGDPASEAIEISARDSGLRWGNGIVRADLRAPDATVDVLPEEIRLTWDVELPPHGTAGIQFSISVEDAAAVVLPSPLPRPWDPPDLVGVDDRLARWVERSLDDLDALRLVSTSAPRDEFLAAGAPWFFTLFGRDAIWSARFLLPLGPVMAGSTLRALAALQGRGTDPETVEQPGKIMHELRRATLELPDHGISLPPLYYGTIDATPLWICLLADARDSGLPEAEVRAMLPNLEAALAWMRDWGDSDGDGLLEYLDTTGHGLSNQGWKDSGDSVQWRDGRLADGPIVLCEVQGYAYEAATRGAAILDEFGGDGEPWRRWANRVAEQFRARFWVEDAAGRFPAIALDAAKRPVDSLTSNIGHLLGTGILNHDERAIVAARLVSPALSSGYGLRTLSTGSTGYWPLSYHGGSVWTHDTAIAIHGLTRDGFHAEARELTEGLLRSTAAFDYRMPELYSGDGSDEVSRPVPYPAACRPQAWAAAASVAVLDAVRRAR